MTLETQATPAPAADTGPLTIEQAVERQLERKAKGPPVEETQDEITEESPEGAGDDLTQDSEAEPQTADEVEGEPTEANAEDEQAEQPEPETPAIEPPQFWDADGKEAFAKLPKEAQEAVRSYEEQRTKSVAKAIQVNAEARNYHANAFKALKEVHESIGAQVDAQAESMQAWEDWFGSAQAQELAKHDPARFVQEQARYNLEKREFDANRAKQATLEKKLYDDHVAEQRRSLAEVAPPLADPKHGPQRMKDTLEYLRGQGFEGDRIRWITAPEALIAWKARQFDSVPNLEDVVRKAALYDKAQKLATTAPTKPKQPKAGPSAPAAGQGQRPSSSEARLKQLEGLKRSWTPDEHVEAMSLKAKLRK